MIIKNDYMIGVGGFIGVFFGFLHWINNAKPRGNENKTQEYIIGSRVHTEQKTEKLWDIFMEDLQGYPVIRDLTKESAEFIIRAINATQKETN